MSPASWRPVAFFTAYATTGESASIASVLPEATAAVAAPWSWNCSIVIGFLPASVHAFDLAFRSSTWTVFVWTATLRPQALFGSTVLPVGAAHWVPAEK